MKVVTVVGTRPEIIRLSRVIPKLDEAVDHVLVHTGQNYDYELDQIFFEELEIRPPDVRMEIDTSSLGRVYGGVISATEEILARENPDALLVLGDTNSCISALMAKRMRIPVYHMEAGNRCFDANVPEEINRRMIDHIADINLAYTEHARTNLLREGLSPRRIYVTGSPLREVVDHYRERINAAEILERLNLIDREYLLVSMHREENVDDPVRLDELLGLLNRLRREAKKAVIVSTHPRTRKRMERCGSFKAENGVRLLKPFGYLDYCQLQKRAYCVVSDSGTIAEESAILEFPAVTIRDSIERPEALDTGSIMLCGTSIAEVLAGVEWTARRFAEGRVPETPREYLVDDCSDRVCNLILGTAHLVNDWFGLRSYDHAWRPDAEDEPALPS